MWIAPAHVVRGERPVTEVADELCPLQPRSTTVVLRQDGRDDHYYVFDTGMLVRGLTHSSAPSVTEALRLHELIANTTVDLDEAARFAPPKAVVLLGRTVVGVVEKGAGDRGVTAWRGLPPNDPGERATAAGGASTFSSSPEVPTTERPASARFRAFPALTAPNTVSAGERFTLRVGFRSTAPEANAVPLIVPGADPLLEFTVQIVGFGFTFPEGIRRLLRVNRDDPETGFAEFTVVANSIIGEAMRSLEVSYEYRGNLCGQAWSEVLVMESQVAGDSVDSIRSGSSGLTVADHDTAPHLTVEIHGQDGSPELRFLFSSRYGDLPRPDDSVRANLDRGSSRAFAIQLMAQIPTTPTESIWEILRGAGRSVADVLPPEFWTLLQFVWRRARQDGEVPTLLLVTADPWVPWELAWVDDRHVDPGLLPKPTSTLGALWQVGRWIPPITRDRMGSDLPATPPERAIDVGGMAVVIGDYTGNGTGELPGAVQEGRDLVTAYGARPLGVADVDVGLLLAGRLVQDERPFHPAVVHFAAHGENNPQAQQYTGVVLRGDRKLDALAVRGSDLPRLSRPFVFLNACEVGTAGELLSTYAGLAGAFLVEGCRGFVAPLWKVGDEDARRVALNFYETALSQGISVGEAIRRIRGEFGPGSASLVSMAYVYYGHPQLELRMSSER
ncbi:MAG: CHAT domain-containing protein [Pseudonocardia sp.]